MPADPDLPIAAGHSDHPVEAESVLRHALAVEEAACGADDPRVAIPLYNLARWLKDRQRLAEAEPLFRRMLDLFARASTDDGQPHQHLQAAIGNYGACLDELGYSQGEILERLQSVLSTAELPVK